MDVQSESSEPPPCDPQPPGKIRKAFKLFGKRKPGSIFSVRGKGEGNNKSPIARSKTTDGLKESAEPETEKEQEPEVSQGKEEEEAVEEPLGDDGDPHVPSAGRPSISSMTSAKSLSFLMKLRRSRRGGPDRRFRTESQPKGRQRRGLKGLFGSMRWNQQEKGPSDDSETPPSPLLMASRTSSVEIIKEDMTLTPRPVPRSPDVPEPGQESPVSSTSPTVQGSSSSSRLETTAASVATDSVTGSTEDVPPPLPTTEPPPLDPPVDRLTSLLADISSLISFDSLTGCGDISAEVEAEWGKASTTVWAGPGTMGPVAGEKAPLTTFSARATPTTKPISPPVPVTTPSSLSSVSATYFAPVAKPPLETSPVTFTSSPPPQTSSSVDSTSAPSSLTPLYPAAVPSSAFKIPYIPVPTHKVPQGPPTEKKTPPLKAAGLSKIPVCGGGRSGKLPLRETQPTDEEGSWDPSTPGREEESPRPGLRHAGSKDTISNSSSVADGEAGPATVKHSPEESRQLRQPAVYGSGSRDSKIPVKLGAQSNIPVPHGAKEPPRSKIPLSKVPVRRIANKPTAPAAAGAQIRK
uniref:APC membrane recruitment protein 2 n=1 Tax=Esox lucius TaxID=8010 RepID=A0A3P8YZV8_ESOLU